jgi:hypothetical protein
MYQTWLPFEAALSVSKFSYLKKKYFEKKLMKRSGVPSLQNYTLPKTAYLKDLAGSPVEHGVSKDTLS